MALLLDGYDNADLPEYVNLTNDDLELYRSVWTRWRATDRKFLPSQLMAEPDRPLSVILELDGIYALIEKQILAEKAKENKTES